MYDLKVFKSENSNRLVKGVYYLSGLHKPLHQSNDFGGLYLKIRTIEGRIYDDDTLKNLPQINRNHLHYKEWMIRKNSSEKLIDYISGIGRELNILELGCGNGWLSNKLAGIKNVNIIGVDINETELEQAARIFWNKENLVFIYADISDSVVQAKLREIKFDIIILAGVLMYFKDLKVLIDTLLGMLNLKGEIHIIDNALYNKNNIENAKENTAAHYRKMGMPEMTDKVHHHLLSELDIYKPDILYNPFTLINRVKRKIFNSNISPFFWMKIVKIKSISS